MSSTWPRQRDESVRSSTWSAPSRLLAAATLGAGRPRTILRVNLPLMRNGLIAALIFGFLLSFEELTVAMFVGGGLKTTLPKQMWDNILLQLDPTLAAASVAILVIVAALFLLAEYLRSGEARP
jgi:putative spermidine/putrescine transport system permease protein